MAYSKSHLYPLEDQILAEFALGIKHPARISILRQLKKEESCNVEQINKNHCLSQPTISGHMGMLYTTEYIWYRERYPYIYYSLDNESIRKAAESFHRLFDELL